MMNTGGHATFRPRLAWTKEEDKPKPRRNTIMGDGGSNPRASTMRRSSRVVKPEPKQHDDDVSPADNNKFLGIFPIQSPTSTRRLYWDIAGMFMLAYDFIMVPLSFFIEGESVFLTFMEWVTLIFWTFDVFASQV